jgi:hypothetical protein
VILLGLTAGAAQAGALVGATAQCRDGTYSFSQHHSGTCSYHGGVAAWLTAGSATIAPSPPTTATSAAATSASASLVEVGKTVLLAARTETAGCKLGANPDRRCSPGAYYSKLTKTVICSPTFRTGPIRNVPVSEKFAVEQEYGIAPGHYGATLEIDHIVSLELGGSNDIANLYPEEADAHPGYRVKDQLENRLHALVCSGAMTLLSVRERIAANWQVLYGAVFGSAPVG